MWHRSGNLDQHCRIVCKLYSIKIYWRPKVQEKQLNFCEVFSVAFIFNFVATSAIKTDTKENVRGISHEERSILREVHF